MSTTLCGASSYTKKYYLAPQFDRLPQDVKDELKIMCVTFTEDVGGILTVEFGEDKRPKFVVRAADNDDAFKEQDVDAAISKLQEDKEALMEKLSIFYRVFVLGEKAEDVLTEVEDDLDS